MDNLHLKCPACGRRIVRLHKSSSGAYHVAVRGLTLGGGRGLVRGQCRCGADVELPFLFVCEGRMEL